MKRKTRKPAQATAKLEDWIAKLFEYRELLRMGHLQGRDDLNLGLGWLYYALARILRPERVVVIGSWRGFVPMVFARALADNGDGGEVLFIDPSLADGFWKDARDVKRYFRSYGLANIRHVMLTTQDFVRSREYRGLRDLKIVFVDGYHTHEQAKFDHEAFAERMAPNGIVLFHDTRAEDLSHRYGSQRTYVRTVRQYMDELAGRRDLQLFDLPFGGGITLVRSRPIAPPRAAAKRNSSGARAAARRPRRKGRNTL